MKMPMWEPSAIEENIQNLKWRMKGPISICVKLESWFYLPIIGNLPNFEKLLKHRYILTI